MRMIPALAIVAALAASSPALAREADQAKPPQGTSPQKPTAAAKPVQKPKVPKLPLGLRAYFSFENESLNASSTFKAVTGSSSFTGLGGGGEVLNVWKKVFARVGVSKASKSGERAILTGGELLSTGVPIELGITTIEISAGWRNYLRKHPRFAWYGGGGLLATKFSETSDFAQPGDNESNTFNGYSLFGGIDAVIWKRVIAGAEVQYRAVPDALGEGGLSKAYGETNLGGFAIRGMIGVRFRK